MLPDVYDEKDRNLSIACIDEVGRGCIAGPVCSAAVIWPRNYEPSSIEDRLCLEKIKDSKKLSPKIREKLADFIKRTAVDYAIAVVDNNEIDKINILQATYKSMHNALDQLTTPFDKIYIDGDKFKTYMNRDGDFMYHTCIVNGDSVLLQIAAASILAKTHRDSLITQLAEADERLQVYGWKKNKGYGTIAHFDAVRKHGLSEYHRKTFIHI